jgi:hypothetical protein
MIDIFIDNMFVQFGGLMFETDDQYLTGYHCIDDVLSLNRSRCGDYLDLISKMELEIKDTIDTL